MYELRHYIDPEGEDLFAHWLDLLGEGGDKRTQSKDIARAIHRWNEWQTRSKR